MKLFGLGTLAIASIFIAATAAPVTEEFSPAARTIEKREQVSGKQKYDLYDAPEKREPLTTKDKYELYDAPEKREPLTTKEKYDLYDAPEKREPLTTKEKYDLYDLDLEADQE
ncbi:hypothetical protein M432DRAFT_673497 [Thermoascus aurantiacus ATCC 26904]